MNAMLINPTNKRISLWLTIQESFLFPWRQRKHLWLWIFLCAALSFFIDFLGERVIGHTGFGEGISFVSLVRGIGDLLLVGIPLTLIFTIFAVSCHRLLLIGNHAVSRLGVSKFTKREMKFLMWWIFIVAIAFLVFIPVSLPLFLIIGEAFELEATSENSNFSLSSYLSTIIAFLPLMYLIGRFSLVLPATAVDQQPTLTWAWAQSKTNAWRLAILVGILPMMFSLITQGAKILGIGQFPLLNSVTEFFLMYGFATIEVAVLSIAFRELTAWVPSACVDNSS